MSNNSIIPWYFDFMPLFNNGYIENVFGKYIIELREIFMSPSFLSQMPVIACKSHSLLMENISDDPFVSMKNFSAKISDLFWDIVKNEIKAKNYDLMKHAGMMFLVTLLSETCSMNNVPMLNPEYIKKLIDSGGSIIFKGMQNLINDMMNNRSVVSSIDKSKFSVGENIAYSEGAVVWQNDLVQLIRYKPKEKVFSMPLFIVPPFINKYYILDLTEKKSVVRWLVEKGYDVFMISWRNPDESMAHLGIEDYVLSGIKESIDMALKISKNSKMNLIGYCIGGTFLMILTAYLNASKINIINSITLLNTLINFSFPGASGIFIKDELIEFFREKTKLIDGTTMGNFFGWLRPEELVLSNVMNNYFLGESPRASDVMYWNSDSPNIVSKMFAQYLDLCYVKNGLRVPNYFNINGVPINMYDIDIPIYCVGGISDHITPCESIFDSACLFKNSIFTLVKSGHVMSVLGIPGFKAYDYYSGKINNAKNVTEWMKSATTNNNDKSSWWDSWHEWHKQFCGEMVAAPVMDKKLFLDAAPGSYVKNTNTLKVKNIK